MCLITIEGRYIDWFAKSSKDYTNTSRYFDCTVTSFKLAYQLNINPEYRHRWCRCPTYPYTQSEVCPLFPSSWKCSVMSSHAKVVHDARRVPVRREGRSLTAWSWIHLAAVSAFICDPCWRTAFPFGCRPRRAPVPPLEHRANMNGLILSRIASCSAFGLDRSL